MLVLLQLWKHASHCTLSYTWTKHNQKKTFVLAHGHKYTHMHLFIKKVIRLNKNALTYTVKNKSKMLPSLSLPLPQEDAEQLKAFLCAAQKLFKILFAALKPTMTQIKCV